MIMQTIRLERKQTELDIEDGEGLFHADDIGAMKHGYGL